MKRLFLLILAIAFITDASAQTIFGLKKTPAGSNAAPVASSVSISGAQTVGYTLTGSYTYSDVDNDVEGVSIKKWYRADNNSGLNRTEVGTGNSYLLQATDEAKYIQFEVTPVAATGTTPGTVALSTYSNPIYGPPSGDDLITRIQSGSNAGAYSGELNNYPVDFPTGINEFDLHYHNGNYYLFYDDRQYTQLRVATTIAGLNTAPAQYIGNYRWPTAAVDGSGNWHLWGWGEDSKLWHVKAATPEGLQFGARFDSPTVPGGEYRYDLHVRWDATLNVFISGYQRKNAPASCHAMYSADGTTWTDLGEIIPVKQGWFDAQEADPTFFRERGTGKLYFLFAGVSNFGFVGGGGNGGDGVETAYQSPGIVEVNGDINSANFLKAVNTPYKILDPHPDTIWHNRHDLPRLFNPVYIETGNAGDLASGDYIFFSQNGSWGGAANPAGWGYLKLYPSGRAEILYPPTVPAQTNFNWTFEFNNSLAETGSDVVAETHSMQKAVVAPSYNSNALVFNQTSFLQLYKRLSSTSVTIETRIRWDGHTSFSGQALVGDYPFYQTYRQIYIDFDGAIRFATDVGLVGWNGVLTSGVYTTLKFVLQNGAVSLYKNDVLVSTQLIAGTFHASTIGGGTIPNISYQGGFGLAQQLFKGHIDWFKIYTGTPGNTTPAPPTLTADDNANTLSASHALGASEIVVSENNGSYVAYSGVINVGDVARAAGYWKFKIKSATGRNESSVVNSPAFTVAGGGGGGSQPISNVNWTGKQNIYHGNSITDGWGSKVPGFGMPEVDTVARWTGRLNRATGATGITKGQAGFLITPGVAQRPNVWTASSNAVSFNAAAHRYVFVCFGVNDMLAEGAGLSGASAANYQTALQNQVNALHNNYGWPYDSIVILAPFYVANTTQGVTAAMNTAYTAASQTVSTTLGTQWIDVNTAMKNRQGNPNSIYDADLIHPKTIGHEFIAETVFKHYGGDSLLPYYGNEIVLNLKNITTTGSMTAGSNVITVASATGYNVGDKIIVETGGEAPMNGRLGGERGTKGVGKQWPTYSYADTTAIKASGRPLGSYNWSEADGRVYRVSASTGFATLYTGYHYYMTWATPFALVATITGINGNQITLDKTAYVATTNANVYFDNQPVVKAAWDAGYRNLLFPAGNFAIGDRLVLTSGRNVKVRGSGATTTTFFSPKGTPSASFALAGASRADVADFGMKGNHNGDHGWAMPSVAYPGDNVTSQMDNPYQHTNGIAFSTTNGGTAKRLKVVNAITYSFQIAYSQGVLFDSLEAIQEGATHSYIGWNLHILNSFNSKLSNATFTSPTLVSGVEFFGSTASMFENVTSHNGTGAFNNAGGCEMKDVTFTFDNNSFYPGYGAINPIIDVNAFIGGGVYAQMGNTIRNVNMTQNGYVDGVSGVMHGVYSRDNTPNLKIYGGSYTKPDDVGGRALILWADGAYVDGFKCFGKNYPGWYTDENYPYRNEATIAVHYAAAYPLQSEPLSTATIINCVADFIFMRSGTTHSNNFKADHTNKVATATPSQIRVD